MKYVGFIKELDNVSFAKDFKNYFTSANRDNLDILKYLDKGISFGGWMSYVSEVEDIDISIAPFEYFTDGEWIWPVYFPYYLKKYKNFYIPIEFIEYLARNKEKQVHFTEKELVKFETNFFRERKQYEEESELDNLSQIMNNENQPYKTYKGKNYTEEEWKVLEEKLYQEYLKKRGK